MKKEPLTLESIRSRLDANYVCAIILSILLIVLLVYCTTEEGQQSHHKQSDNWNSISEQIDDVKKLSSAQDIEDLGTRNKIIRAINNRTDVIVDPYMDYSYGIVRVDSTNREIELVECKYNPAKNVNELYWKLSDTQGAEYEEKLAIFQVYNVPCVDLVLKEYTSIIENPYKEVLAIKQGEQFILIDAKTNRELDFKPPVWYGEGVYGVTLKRNDDINIEQDNTESALAASENQQEWVGLESVDPLPGVEVEGVVKEQRNREGYSVIDIGRGTTIEAINTGDYLIEGMIYQLYVYYDNGFKVIAQEELCQPTFSRGDMVESE